jgi:hypothetical protein
MFESVFKLLIFVFINTNYRYTGYLYLKVIIFDVYASLQFANLHCP